MIITPEDTRQLISPFEEPEEQAPPSMSLLNQGAIVISNNELDEFVQKEKLETLKKQNVSQIRQTASIINQQKEAERFNRILQTTDNQEIISTALQSLAEKQQRNRTALEEEVISTFEKKVRSNPVDAYIYDNDKGFFERLHNRAKKELIVSNKLDEIKNKADSYDKGLNLLSEFGLVNFLQRSFGMGLLDYGAEIRALQTRLENASPEETLELLEESEELIRSTQILGDNPQYVFEELQLALQGSRDEQFSAGVFNVFDFADTALIGKNLLGAGISIIPKGGLSKAALDVGASDEVAQDIVQGERKIVDTDEQAIGLGSGLKTEFDTEDLLSSSVRKEYQVNQRILNEVLDEFRGVDYEDVVSLDLFENVKERLKKDFSNGSINDITLKSDGMAEVVITKHKGEPYASQGTAKAALTKRGFEGEVFELPQGGWAIKAQVPSLDAEVANLSTKGVSNITRYLRRPEAWIDDQLLVNAQISENTMNAITKAGQTVYDNSIGKLNKKEINNILPLIDSQREARKWLTPKELDIEYRSLYGRPISEKEMNALSGYRLLNDFQYNLDNKVIYEKRKAQGYGSLDRNVFGFDVDAKKTNDLYENEYVFFNDSLTAVNKNSLPNDFADKYDIIRVQSLQEFRNKKGYEALNENPTPYIAVPKDSVEINDLNPRPLRYLEGGRVRYDESAVWIKQPDVGTYENGKKFRRNDKTFFTATSFGQGKKEVDGINLVNTILRKGRDNPEVLAEADGILKKRLLLGTDNINEYLDKIDSIGLDIEKEVSVVRNREVIKGSELPTEFVDDLDFEDVRNGRLSARGHDTIPHINPDETSLLNAVASLNQNFKASASNASFSAYRDYTLSYLERYRPFLQVNSNASRLDLLDAPIKDGSGLTSSQINKIKGEQQFAREVIGRRTEEEMAALRDTEKAVEWALDNPVGRIIWGDPSKTVANVSGSLREDPIGRIRGLVFNAKLGLFSLPAMIIQAAHAPIIAAMSPRHGIKAMATYPVIRMALASKDPQVIKEFAKKAEALDLKGYGDLEDFFSEFRRLGFDSFGANMVYENAARGDNVIRGGWEKFADKGRMFFEEGELVPRITAYSTAVREWVANVNNINPKGLGITDKAASKYIVQRTNTLTLGMTRADLQQGLKGGWMGLLAQFQSYPMRALDAILFPSKGLTKGERSRMAAAYLIMYGAAGLPMAQYFANWAAGKLPEDTSDTVYKMLYNGVVDGLVMAATGENTNFASRGGLGSWSSEIVESFFGDEKNFMDVLLGPAGSTGSGAVDTLVQYAKAWSAGYNPDPSRITGNVLLDVAKQVSSFNNLYRSWIAYHTGNIFDSRGRQFIEISNTKNVLQLLGLPPQEYEDIGMIYSSREKRKQIIDLNTELLTHLHNEYARTGDPKIIEQINTVSFYIQQDGLSQEVNSAVRKRLTSDSTYKELIRQGQIRNNMGKKALPTEIEVLND